MEELQNKVNELEVKVQEQSCTISSLESENAKVTRWWLDEQSKYKEMENAYKEAVKALKSITSLLKAS